MAKSGPVILIDDDKDDQEVLESVLTEMQVKNTRHYFSNCREAFTYLKTTAEKPFIILCDVNIPGQNGLDFKMSIDEDHELRAKSIPFVFFSTAVDQPSVNKAYKEMTVQGFFKKENTFDQLIKTLTLIFDYWNLCKHPNS